MEYRAHDRVNPSYLLEPLLQLTRNPDCHLSSSRESRHCSSQGYHSSSRDFPHSSLDCHHYPNPGCLRNQERLTELPNKADIQVALQVRLPEASLEHLHRFQVSKQLLRRNSELHNLVIRASNRAIPHNPVSSRCQDIRHNRDSN